MANPSKRNDAIAAFNDLTDDFQKSVLVDGDDDASTSS